MFWVAIDLAGSCPVGRCPGCRLSGGSCLDTSENKSLVVVNSGGFKVGGARGKTKKGSPSDDVIILSQP